MKNFLTALCQMSAFKKRHNAISGLALCLQYCISLHVSVCMSVCMSDHRDLFTCLCNRTILLPPHRVPRALK